MPRSEFWEAFWSGLASPLQVYSCRHDPAGAEDGGADADLSGAEADRGLEIGAHPHAELVEPVAPGDLA